MAEESVGRVSVEVVPDADNFGREAEAQLKKQRIDPKNVNVVPVIDANMAKLNAQVTAIAKSLDRSATVSVQADFSGTPIADLIKQILPVQDLELHASFDPTSEAGLRRTLKQIEDTFATRHELVVDASSAESAAETIRATLQRIEAEKVRIATELVLDEERIRESARQMHLRLEADFDFSGMRAEFEAEMRRLEVADWKADVEARVTPTLIEARAAEVRARLARIFRDMAVGIAVSLDNAHLRVAQAELGVLARARDVALHPVVVQTARAVATATLALISRDRVVNISVITGRSLANIASVLSGFHALRESVDVARRVLTGVFTNLPGVAAATVGIFALSGALLSAAANMAGLAGSAAQALPILLSLGGVAVGVAITVAAFKDFATVLPGVVAQFKGLQDVISQAFWAPGTGAVAGIEAFTAGIMGPLQAGLQQASAAIGAFVGSFATELGSVLGGEGGALSGWFDNLTASVVAFQPFIFNIVSIFRQFGDVGSAMLVPLAGLVGNLIVRFDSWFASLVAGQGGVAGFAAATVAAFAGIIETVISLGAVFGAVFRAAEESGAASFTSIAGRLESFAQTLNSNRDTMVGLFNAAQQMWANFADQAGGSVSAAMDNFATLLTAVLPVVGSILGTMTELFASIITPDVTAGIQAFVGGISAGVEALKPAFAPLGNLLAALGPVLGTLATAIGTVFGALAPSIAGIVQALGPLIEKLSGGLLIIIQKLQVPIGLLATALVEALGNPSLMAAIDAIVNAFVALIPALTPIIGLASTLVAALLPLVATILEPLAGLISMIVPLFLPLATVIGAVVGAVTPLIPILVNLIAAVLEPILPLIVTLVSALLPVLVPIIQVLATVLQLVIALLTPLIEAILPPLVGILNAVVSVIGLVVTALVGAFTAAITWIQEKITELSTGISAFFDKWQEIWNNVASFFTGLWEGLLNWIKDLLGIHSPSTWFLDLASNMLQGMLDGLTAGWEFIKGFLVGAWNWLLETVTVTFNTVNAVVKAAWDAVTGLFSAAWVALKIIVTTGWNTIKSFFVDGVTRIKTTVSEAWERVKSFFSEGITNAVNLVKGLPAKVVGALSGIGSTLYNSGRDLIQGLINGAGSLLSRIGSWFLDKLPSWIREPFKAALGINSPSTVFQGFGENIIDGLIEGMESRHRLVFRSMDRLAAGVGDTRFNLPNITGGGLSAVAAMIASSFTGGSSHVLNYYAAPGSSVGSEEDLFAAMGRGRAWGF